MIKKQVFINTTIFFQTNVFRQNLVTEYPLKNLKVICGANISCYDQQHICGFISS